VGVGLLVVIDELGLTISDEPELEGDWRIVECAGRMGAAMADLKGERVAVEAGMNERLGHAGCSCDGLARLAAMQVEEDCAGEASAFVGDGERDSGQALHLAAPDAGDGRGGCRLRGCGWLCGGWNSRQREQGACEDDSLSHD
jgi:hypothetical protein